MEKPLLSLLLAFTGYSLQNIALAVQKLALSMAPRRRAVAVWALATAAMPAAIVLVLRAVSLGNAALVGVMAGTGLASLALFSHFVLREAIRRQELAGVGVVLLAALLIGAFGAGDSSSPPRPMFLYAFMAAVTAAYTAAWLALRPRSGAVGLVIAALAGAIGGFIPLLQKLSTTPEALARPLIRIAAPASGPALQRAAQAAAVLTNPWGLAWIAASLLSMLVIQFAYRYDRAVRLIPAFAANTIAVPVVGGVLAFGTRLHPLQWLGVAAIGAGVLLLTWKGNQPAAAGENRAQGESADGRGSRGGSR